MSRAGGCMILPCLRPYEYASVESALAAQPQAALVVTHRVLSATEETILTNGVLYRPKVLALGIGCNRGTAAEEIEAVITETLAELQFSIKSVKAICTIDLKKDEEGLLAVTHKYSWPLVTYTPEQLNEVHIEAPSDTVHRFTGAYGVSEPAAKLYSGASELALTKKKSGNVTISVGLIDFEKLAEKSAQEAAEVNASDASKEASTAASSAVNNNQAEVQTDGR